MAREVIINAKINTGNSAKEVGDVLKSTKELKDETQGVNKANATFEQRLKSLNKEVKAGDLGVRQLTRKIKDYQDIALQAGADSPIGRQAIADASQLQDRLDSLNTRVKSLSDDGVALKSALAIGQGVVQGYQGFLGVQTLLGTENERMLEVLTKLQGAQAVVNSLSAVRNALDKDQIANYKQLLTGITANTVAQKAYAIAVGTSTGAMKLFRLALIATGIGAIVVAIGMLIANFDKVTGVVNKATDRFKRLGNGMKTLLSIIFPFIGAIRMAIWALEELGVIENDQDRERERNAKKQLERMAEERAERDKNIKKLEEEHNEFRENAEFELRMMRAKGASSEELVEAEQKLRREILANNLARGRELVGINDLIMAERDLLHARGEIEEGNRLNDLVKENNAKIREINQANRKLLQDIKIADAQQKTDLEKQEKAHQKELQKIRKQADDERRKLEADFLAFVQLVNDRLLSQETMFWQQSINNRLNDLDQLQSYYEQKLLTDEQYLQQRNAINEFYDEQERERLEANRLQAEQEERERQEQASIQAEEILMRELANQQMLRELEIDAENQKQQELVDLYKNASDARMAIGKQFYNNLMTIGDLFQGESEEQQRRAFEINKAGAIADTVISTIKSAQLAYQSQAGIPVVGPALGAAMATAVGAMGALNVRKISQTPFQNARAQQSAPPPSFNGANQMNQNQPIQLFGEANNQSEVQGNQNITVTAKVVETDMTDTQNDVANINELGEL